MYIASCIYTPTPTYVSFNTYVYRTKIVDNNKITQIVKNTNNIFLPYYNYWGDDFLTFPLTHRPCTNLIFDGKKNNNFYNRK